MSDDPTVQAVAEVLHAECLWIDADLAASLAESAVAAAEPHLTREAKAEALRDAADDLNARANRPELIASADRWGGYYSGVRVAMQNEEATLRTRADRIEAVQ